MNHSPDDLAQHRSGFRLFVLTVVLPSAGPVSVSVPSALFSRLRAFLLAGHPLVQLRALLLLALGWLLSPLCWWNDLVINLPIAWGLAKLCEVSLGLAGKAV